MSLKLDLCSFLSWTQQTSWLLSSAHNPETRIETRDLPSCEDRQTLSVCLCLTDPVSLSHSWYNYKSNTIYYLQGEGFSVWSINPTVL
jgi:hypothetical protein